MAISTPLYQRTWFWVLFAVISAGAAVVSIKLFPLAYPLLSLDIKMDRAGALREARKLAATHHWGPPGDAREVVGFESDEETQAFVELEGGGKDAFSAMMREGWYTPFSWHVRLFREGETNQTHVRFRPDGTPYCFEEMLKQRAPGAALTADRAREIAEASARAAPWSIALDQFKAVEASQVTRPGGRIDHSFVYERPDRTLGDGRYRLKLVVSGDRLTELNHLVKIPEAFKRRYEQMRSANTGISFGAVAVMGLLYILIGGMGGLLLLLRGRDLLWRPALKWAALIVALQMLSSINAWPLDWMRYDTALSAGNFAVERVMQIILGNLVLGILFFISFAVAEGLSRRAFPDHPQLWRVWSRDAGASLPVLGRTLGGFLLVPFHLVYVFAFYFLALSKFGWWLPSGTPMDPDMLAHYWPWLTPIAISAQAGFWEEALFRAIPLAGAALLGDRFGGRRWWIAGAFVFQAVVFGAAHANYAGQPAYSRLVELILPSFMFGALYLRFGLLTGVVAHFAYDVVLFAMPLFAMSVPGVWVDRGLLIVLLFLPVWIVLLLRWRAGAWTPLPEALRNSGWQSPQAPEVVVTAAPFATVESSSPRLLRNVLIAAALAVVVLCFVPRNAAGLGPGLAIGRAEAGKLARAELDRRGVKLAPAWRTDVDIPDRPASIDRFSWQTAGPAGYRELVGAYVPPPRWRVRFATFTGDVAERAEEWSVFLDGGGVIRRVWHSLPEDRPGANLTEAEAREFAGKFVRETWSLDPAALKEISASSAKRPKRTDWTFIWSNPAVKSLDPGEARVQVVLAGDAVSDARRLVFVPEDWERADRARESQFKTGRMVRGLVTGLIIIFGLVASLMAVSQGKLVVRVAVMAAGVIFATAVLATLNRLPAAMADFETAKPLKLQLTLAIVPALIGALFAAGSMGLLAGLVTRWVPVPRTSSGKGATLGVGVGLVVLAGFTAANLLRTAGSPGWPDLAGGASFVPWLAPSLAVGNQLISRTLLLLLIFGGLERAAAGHPRQRVAGHAIAWLACSVVMLPAGGPDLTHWLAAGMASGAVLALANAFVVRHDLSILPLMVAVPAGIEAISFGAKGMYPGAMAGGVLAALVAFGLAWWGMQVLRGVAMSRTGATPAA